MITYHYRCDDCHKEHDIKQKITDNALEICPSCGGHVKRVITSGNFVLKGEHWFKHSGSY